MRSAGFPSLLLGGAFLDHSGKYKTESAVECASLRGGPCVYRGPARDGKAQMEYEGGVYEIDMDSLPVVLDPEAFVRLSAERTSTAARPQKFSAMRVPTFGTG